MEELRRRLERPIDAAEIPGTQLMQIAQRYMAYLENIEKAAKELEDETPLSPLEIVDKPGLSLERRYEILADYYDEIIETMHTVSDRLKEMHAELFGGEDDDNEKV